MQFKLVPILDKMEALYNLPRNRERFDAYLSMLQDPRNSEMILPIAGYNPMGAELVSSKVRELQSLQAEALIAKELQRINNHISSNAKRVIEVVINLADDIGGAWSNFYTTDYSSKFDIGAIIKRDFCTPYFWTSESYSEELIVQRTREAAYRTLFWLEHAKPQSLQDFLEQEVYVLLNSSEQQRDWVEDEFFELEQYYLKNAASEDYNLIFNFFYGDEASQSLQYTAYGLTEMAGFNYAKYLAYHRRMNA
ncbi:MAG: hypothetical protein AB8H47_17720 [Bacteroidia bacterium]